MTFLKAACPKVQLNRECVRVQHKNGMHVKFGARPETPTGSILKACSPGLVCNTCSAYGFSIQSIHLVVQPCRLQLLQSALCDMPNKLHEKNDNTMMQAGTHFVCDASSQCAEAIGFSHAAQQKHLCNTFSTKHARPICPGRRTS